MKRLRWILVGIVLLIILASVGFVVFAPEANDFFDNLGGEPHADVTCLSDAMGACLRLPLVTGVDVDNDLINFPDAFDSQYILVVMPFDREQQVNAVTWLPIFQELSQQYDNVNYYNIAALPELNLAIRGLVIGGMSAGIRDATVRDRTTILFLQDQARFLDTLQITDTEAIAVFIIGQDGTLFYHAIGTFNTIAGQDLREQLALIVQ